MRRLKLHHQIALAMLLGAALGASVRALAGTEALDPDAALTAAAVGQGLGTVFLRLLQMLVVPLIVSSLVSGVAGLGDLRRLGPMGARTIAFYLGSSAIAILTGIAAVQLVEPGVGVDRALLESGAEGHALPAAVSAPAQSALDVLYDQLLRMIPTNPIAAAAEGAMLPLIFFSLLLGVFLNLSEHDPDAGPTQSAVVRLRELFEGLFAVMMRMTLAVIALAPLGVFGFMLSSTAAHGAEAFVALGGYAATVAIALVVHAGFTLPLLLIGLTRRNPLEHVRAMLPALMTAFGTASSNGTLPLTLECAEKAGVPGRVGAFVLPLGATINMDGTALYEAVAVLFIAQVYGLDLSLTQQGVVALTALLASVGAAGIPHAGTVMMVVVLSAVGLPTTAVGLILAVDRVLDMCRTAVNVYSDSVAAAVVAHFEARRDADSV
ncbi:MAG: dicarboxylate/amino acid:cation symporter [Myxococcales bacterium]|nr:dicarboxylate/amino acid:cation symporter [Myxococcales bacterium]